jgi:hypothetical protein
VLLKWVLHILSCNMWLYKGMFGITFVEFRLCSVTVYNSHNPVTAHNPNQLLEDLKLILACLGASRLELTFLSKIDSNLKL